MAHDTAQTVIFDLGDVVLDTDTMASCRRLAHFSDLDANTIYEVLYERDAIVNFSSGRMTGEQFSDWCRSEAHINLDTESFYDCYCDIFYRNEGVAKLIEQLRPTSQLLLLSNTNPWHFPYCDRKFDIRSRFNHTILSYEAGALKPDRAIYRSAMPHVRHPEKVVFIDDRQEHLDGAEPFGIQGVRFVDISQLRTDLANLGYL